MNIFDQNCTFTLNLPIISLIDNKRQHQQVSTIPTSPFNIQNFTNYQNSYIQPSSTVQADSAHDNPNNNNLMESDLTELSWLTKNSLDLFKESLTNTINLPTISAKLIHLSSKSKTVTKENDIDKAARLKVSNDKFLKTSFVKVNSLNNINFSINNVQPDLNGDLDSSFSSSISTSSSSSLNSNENSESISKYLNNNFDSLSIKQKFQQLNNKDNDFTKGISTTKKMKLNEYFEPNVNHDTNKQAAIEVKTENEANDDKNDNSNQMLINNNDHMNKPPLTLSCLIFMAIQESKYKCLPVREIYEWIENNFPYYKFAKTGWKSSIRHNLSFSKCFKKMDRLESCKFLTNNNQNLVNSYTNLNLKQHKVSNYQQRTNYVAGTCWQVNPECKSFLMQTLKKSSFWFKYNKSYPNITKLMQNYYNNEENLQHANQHSHHHHHSHSSQKANNGVKEQHVVNSQQEIISSNIEIKNETGEEESKLINDEASNSNSSDNESYFNNLVIDNDYGSEEDDDVTRAAEILYKNSFLIKNLPYDLGSVNTESSSLINCDNQINSFITNTGVNSDLEIEVASTLVRLKSLIEIRN